MITDFFIFLPLKIVPSDDFSDAQTLKKHSDLSEPKANRSVYFIVNLSLEASLHPRYADRPS